MQSEITIIQPDDWHCHLRDGKYLARTVADAAAQFHRVIAMPNLKQPVTTVDAARAYHDRILQHIPAGNDFTPLMTLYLTDQMTPQTILEAKNSGFIVACKLYPAGATTNSAYGIEDLSQIYPVFEAMQESGLRLLIHGESINPATDIFDRETEFVDTQLSQLLHDFPGLKIVLEHISTQHAVEFVKNAPANLAATITPHHLMFNRNALLSGGIKPHYYCLPILKRADDQQALIEAAISGNPKFFLGTDSAPHAQHKKESPCGCAGIYSAHAAIEFYTQVFEHHDALDKLEAFASIHGPSFYGLPVNDKKITLRKNTWTIPNNYPFGDEIIVPMMAGDTLQWQRQ